VNQRAVDSTANSPDTTSSGFTCPDLTSMDIDYASAEGGHTTPASAARSFAGEGQVVDITSRTEHQASFTSRTADGELRARGTAFQLDGFWLVDHITTCDPARPRLDQGDGAPHR
jgi:hypothetical protein